MSHTRQNCAVYKPFCQADVACESRCAPSIRL